MLALASSGVILGSPLLLLHGTPGSVRPASAAPARGPMPLPGFERVAFLRRLKPAPPGAVPSPVTVPTTTPTTPTTTPALATVDISNQAPAAAPSVNVATTTGAPPPTTTAAASEPAVVVTASSSTTGQATWYAEAAPGMCASPFLPMGTEVEVVDDATGASVACQVDDREGTDPGRVLDMSLSGFTQLAPATRGVITVTISW